MGHVAEGLSRGLDVWCVRNPVHLVAVLVREYRLGYRNVGAVPHVERHVGKVRRVIVVRVIRGDAFGLDRVRYLVGGILCLGRHIDGPVLGYV